LFAAIHVANHLAALAGVPTHLAFMKTARLAYRNHLIEPLLLAAVLAQLISGLILVASGFRARRGFVPWLQAWCGLYLAFFLVIHVGAVLYGRLVLHLDTNFYYAAAGFHVPPFAWFFAPYYLLAVIALFTHLGCALSWRVSDRHRKLAVAGPFALGTAVSMLIVLGLAGVLTTVDVPDRYKSTYGGAGADR
jgi:succinate dehydrogenase hydrophobic anchor subunit